MSRLEVWFLHLSTLLVGGTGIVYAVMRYVLKPQDPFGVVNHPLQPTVQHLHVLFSPLLVFAVGLIWRRHVWASWRSGLAERRRTGLDLIVSMGPMVVSGYLVQVAASERWRAVWTGTHLAASTLWVLGYVAHLVSRRRSAGLEMLAGESPETARVASSPRAASSPRVASRRGAGRASER